MFAVLVCALLGACEEDRFYVWVELPEQQQRLLVPVINGYLPKITKFSYWNETRYVLDYGLSARVSYNDVPKHCGCVCYLRESLPSKYESGIPSNESSRNELPPRQNDTNTLPGPIFDIPKQKLPVKLEDKPLKRDPLQSWLRNPSEVK